METEDRWYVRFRGHTLGPLTSEQVKASVRGKELGPDDKLASTSNPSWRSLRTQAEFLRCWESLHRPLPVELTPLPSPKILWQKKRAPLPRAPEVKVIPAIAPVPEAAPTRNKTASPKAKKAASSRAKASKAKKTKPKTPKAAPTAKAPASAAADPAPIAALREIPEKPQFLQTPPTEFAALPASSPPVSIPASAPIENHPKLAEETLSLLEALRDWNRNEQSRAQESRIEPAKNAPAPVPLSQPQPMPDFFSAPPETPEKISKPRNIELKLNLTLSKQFIFTFAAVTALALAALIFSLNQTQKMRGPADSRLPNPSSPTADPSAENDPIPQLKAPTRPKRD